MPVTTSATKALRKDRRRTKINRRRQEAYKSAVKAVRNKPTQKALNLAFGRLDQAAKKKVIHPNKASRLKARLASLIKKPVASPIK